MKRRAFTLVELLVVIAIIGLLSTIAVISLGASSMNARNATRKANLVQLSKALEFYYSDNNGYPPTHVPPITGTPQWHGACSGYGSYPDTGSGAWIPDFSAYLTQLPHDPNTNKTNPNSTNTSCQQDVSSNCFLYISDGIDFKLIAHCTPEGTLSSTDPFYANSGRGTYSWQISSEGGYSKW